MRLFALVGALLIAAGAWWLVSGGMSAYRAVNMGTFSLEVWTADFWLLTPADPGHGLSVNGHWAARLVGGMVVIAAGTKILRITSR